VHASAEPEVQGEWAEALYDYDSGVSVLACGGFVVIPTL
jgi:hypothetical protein